MSDSAEGSPSPNIHFRELDVEFLQKQARIWLEAVLGERFDEDTTLADLLADGEILQRVSSIIGGLLQKHSDGESASPRSLFPETASNGKHSGKYLPYSNIDAFLKVCQKVGLTGVDLFSPPDVVEEKDIRRVCLCIRALSKKVQVRHPGVPNFDYVTHSVAMPTDLVGGLRESLTTHAKSAKKSPLGTVDNESKETPEKIRLNPLLHKRPDDNEDTIGPSSFSSPELLKNMVESGSLSLVKDADGKMDGETFRTTKSTNGLPYSEGSNDMNDSKSPYKMEEDTAFLRGSRHKVNRALFEDHRDTKQGSNLDKNHLDSLQSQKVISSVTSSNGENPCIILCTTDPLIDASKGHSKDMEHGNILKQSAGEKLSDQGKQGKPRRRTWVPIVSIATALLGAVFVVIRAREPTVYQVRKGDTLSEISRRAGKSNWEELAHLNPGIQNPDLIYPSEKLRLRA